MRERFWRDPPPPSVPQGRVTTLAHLGGASATDFTRTETRELFLAVTAAIKAGARTKREVLDALPPALREHAEWIEAAGAEQFAAVDALPPEKLQRAANEAVTALRVLNARRELARLRAAQADDPANLDLRVRVLVLSRFLHEATKAYPRAEGMARAAAGRERDPLPGRAPIEELRKRRGGAA